MRLNELKLSDRGIFERHLSLKKHSLAVYAFANIYIWRKFFDIRWTILEESLCVFFSDKIGSFLYLAPLAGKHNPAVVSEVFRILDKLNKNRRFAHIENIEEEDLAFFKGLGLGCELKSHDYLCRRTDLAQLKGNRFKSKRSSCNYFIKHNDFKFEKLRLKDRDGCLKLYGLWMHQRKTAVADPLYQGMLADSRVSLEEALDNYSGLGLEGALVRVNKEIKGFTLGFALSADTFCVLYEITDLSIKGLAQFIFRRFSQELAGYRFVNIMDDSGLENLKKVKLSYHPEKLVPAYIARKKDADR